MLGSKSATSLMFSVGDMTPVYVIYKSEHTWDTQAGPEGARHDRSKSLEEFKFKL